MTPSQSSIVRTYGYRTRLIAELLRNNLQLDPVRYGTISVRFDHGRQDDIDVCQPTSYMGRRYGADATLSGLDIVLLYDDEVFLVIEVEESSARPKLILGDVFGAVLAKRIAIQGKSFPIKEATMIVAVTTRSRGQLGKKCLRLERLLNAFLSTLRASGIRAGVNDVRIVACPSDDLIRRVERLARLEAGKRVRASHSKRA